MNLGVKAIESIVDKQTTNQKSFILLLYLIIKIINQIDKTIIKIIGLTQKQRNDAVTLLLRIKN